MTKLGADGLLATLDSKRRANIALFASQYKSRTNVIRMPDSVTKGNYQEEELTQGELGSQIQENNTRWENLNKH